jgi:hypothetical protein
VTDRVLSDIRRLYAAMRERHLCGLPAHLGEEAVEPGNVLVEQR